jgi:hypothetical protein
MALLTNEQIAELVGLASNQSTSKDLYEEFHEWNEKQTGIQVNVNWSRSPDTAIGASIDVTWINENGFNVFGYYLSAFYRPKPVITPHPHAEMIAKYAEVAARRIDPWVEFECFDEYDGKWKKHDRDIKFNSLNKFRHIGETK